MKKLIFAINTSLDGCVDHTKFTPDEEPMGYFTNLTRDADTFIYGRKTYQLMFPYWPDVARDPAGQTRSDYEFALAYLAIEKILVFSRTLNSSDNEKARIARMDLQEEIRQLKAESGKNILTGGVTLPSQLADLGLIDEYHIVLHPIVVGEGRRLFDFGVLRSKLQLKFAGSTAFKSGVIALRYLKQ